MTGSLFKRVAAAVTSAARHSAIAPALCLLAAVSVSCSAEPRRTSKSPSTQNAARTTQWKPPEARVLVPTGTASPPDASAAMPNSVGTPAARTPDAGAAGSEAGAAAAGADAGKQPASMVAGQPASMVAGQPASMVAGQPAASGADAAPPATMPTTPSTASAGCSRDELRAAADAFLVALFNGDAQSLGLDPNFRYTENSEVLPVDGGLWRSRPSSEYARHFLRSLDRASRDVDAHVPRGAHELR
jgi:hypothetical protein